MMSNEAETELKQTDGGFSDGPRSGTRSELAETRDPSNLNEEDCSVPGDCQRNANGFDPLPQEKLQCSAMEESNSGKKSCPSKRHGKKTRLGHWHRNADGSKQEVQPSVKDYRKSNNQYSKSQPHSNRPFLPRYFELSRYRSRNFHQQYGSRMPDPGSPFRQSLRRDPAEDSRRKSKKDLPESRTPRKCEVILPAEKTSFDETGLQKLGNTNESDPSRFSGSQSEADFNSDYPVMPPSHDSHDWYTQSDCRQSAESYNGVTHTCVSEQVRPRPPLSSIRMRRPPQMQNWPCGSEERPQWRHCNDAPLGSFRQMPQLSPMRMRMQAPEHRVRSPNAPTSQPGQKEFFPRNITPPPHRMSLGIRSPPPNERPHGIRWRNPSAKKLTEMRPTPLRPTVRCPVMAPQALDQNNIESCPIQTRFPLTDPAIGPQTLVRNVGESPQIQAQPINPGPDYMSECPQARAGPLWRFATCPQPFAQQFSDNPQVVRAWESPTCGTQSCDQIVGECAQARPGAGMESLTTRPQSSGRNFSSDLPICPRFHVRAPQTSFQPRPYTTTKFEEPSQNVPFPASSQNNVYELTCDYPSNEKPPAYSPRQFPEASFSVSSQTPLPGDTFPNRPLEYSGVEPLTPRAVGEPSVENAFSDGSQTGAFHEPSPLINSLSSNTLPWQSGEGSLILHPRARPPGATSQLRPPYRTAAHASFAPSRPPMRAAEAFPSGPQPRTSLSRSQASARLPSPRIIRPMIRPPVPGLSQNPPHCDFSEKFTAGCQQTSPSTNTQTTWSDQYSDPFPLPRWSPRDAEKSTHQSSEKPSDLGLFGRPEAEVPAPVGGEIPVVTASACWSAFSSSVYQSGHGTAVSDSHRVNEECSSQEPHFVDYSERQSTVSDYLRYNELQTLNAQNRDIAMEQNNAEQSDDDYPNIDMSEFEKLSQEEYCPLDTNFLSSYYPGYCASSDWSNAMYTSSFRDTQFQPESCLSLRKGGEPLGHYQFEPDSSKMFDVYNTYFKEQTDSCGPSQNSQTLEVLKSGEQPIESQRIKERNACDDERNGEEDDFTMSLETFGTVVTPGTRYETTPCGNEMLQRVDKKPSKESPGLSVCENQREDGEITDSENRTSECSSLHTDKMCDVVTQEKKETPVLFARKELPTEVFQEELASKSKSLDAAQHADAQNDATPFQTKYRGSSKRRLQHKSVPLIHVGITRPFLSQASSHAAGKESNAKDNFPTAAKAPQSPRRHSFHDYWYGLPDTSGADSSTKRENGASKDTDLKRLSLGQRAGKSYSDVASQIFDDSPLALNFDMSRYAQFLSKEGNEEEKRKKRRSRNSLEDKPKLLNEPSWPRSVHGRAGWSVENCVIAGDSITKPLKLAAPTRNVHVVAAPGCTLFAPAQEKWTERFWLPLMQRLQQPPEVKILVLHIGTNDVGSKTDVSSRFVFGTAMKLLRRLWAAVPDMRIVYSSIIPRSTNYLNPDVTEALPLINNTIYEVNDKMEEHAAKEDRMGFLDNHDLFRDQASAYYKDGLHLSDEGTKILARNIRIRLEEDLQNLANSEDALDSNATVEVSTY